MSLKVNEPSFTDELMSLKTNLGDKFASPYSVSCAWEQLKQIKKKTFPGVIPGSLMFAVGYHPNLPVEVMWEIAHYGDDNACEGLAANLNVPIEIMVFLRTSSTEWVRQAVVRNARCPVELVGEFTSDSLVVKSLVASKKDVPLEVLEQFVGGSSCLV